MSSVDVRSLHQLYEQDYALWIEAVLAQLQAREANNLDWEHLISHTDSGILAASIPK